MSSEVLFDFLLKNPSSFEAFVGSMCAMVAIFSVCVFACFVVAYFIFDLKRKDRYKNDNKDKEDK